MTGLAIKGLEDVSMGKGAARQRGTVPREMVSKEYTGTHCSEFSNVQGNTMVDGSCEKVRNSDSMTASSVLASSTLSSYLKCVYCTVNASLSLKLNNHYKTLLLQALRDRKFSHSRDCLANIKPRA